MKESTDTKMAFKYLLRKEIPKIFDQILKDPLFDGIKERADVLAVELACYVELFEFAQMEISRITREMKQDPKKLNDILLSLRTHPGNKAENPDA